MSCKELVNIQKHEKNVVIGNIHTNRHIHIQTILDYP